MRTVSIIIDGISNSGGTDKVATLLSNEFSQLGYKAIIYPLKKGEPYYPVNDKVIISCKYKNRYLNLISAFKNIKNSNTDVIIISMGRLSLECGFLIRLFNAKNNFICSDHVSLASFSKMKRILKLNAYKHYTSIAVLTEADKKNLENEKLFIPIKVIRNISSFNNNKNIYKYKSNVVIAIGRLSYQKNFSRLIDIWCEMDTIGWELKIIGDGEEKINLLTKINKRDCKNINIVNATKNIENYYKDAALLAMTSRYEGLPMVLIEAKSFALPVIAFDCETGPKEIICKDGVLINYRDDESYIKEFQLLLNNESVRKELSNNARKNSEKYSPNYIIQQWKELLSD